jgi:CIC family chloride channel protein
MNATLLGSTVVASVAAVIVERSILGNNPIFHVPAYHLVNPAELIGYLVLGIVGGIVSLAFCKGLLRARLLFRGMPKWTKILQPALGGLIIGVILIFFPQVMGVGYQFVDQAMNGGLLLKTMLLLCLAKLVATIVSYSSGNAGGIFAPSLYLGAMAGGAVGVLMHRFAPFPTSDPGAYALVGMGTLFAGIIRAPMTSVFMIFELTQDYQVLVPLMVANMISYLISKRYQPVPLYRALLEQDDVHLPQPGTGPVNGLWRARDVMTRDFTLVSPDSSVQLASGLASQTNAESLPVGSDGIYLGLVTRGQIERALSSGAANASIASIVTGDCARVHPDHPLELVLDRLAKNPGLLPVVSRDQMDCVEGMITPETVIQFVQKELDRPKNGSTNPER